MATFIEASMANGAPADTALVNPLSTSSPRLFTARTACSAMGSSSPKGAGTDPRLWYVAWKWQFTMPGMTVRPPRSTTRSSGRASATGPVPTAPIRSPSTTTWASARAEWSPSTTVASVRTSREARLTGGPPP